MTNNEDPPVHGQKGFFAELAGSEACLALGHPASRREWGGDLLCLATSYEVACDYCGGDCVAAPDDVTRDDPGAAPSVQGRIAP